MVGVSRRVSDSVIVCWKYDGEVWYRWSGGGGHGR